MIDYSNLADIELADLLKKSDQLAYAEIYDRFQPLLYVYACKVVKDEDEAADIVQDVFIYIWDRREALDFKASVSSYLYTAVRYKFINLLDHKKVRSNYRDSLQSFINKGEYVTDNYIREKELVLLIEREVALLPEKMREIFILSRKHNLSNKEIALQLNISEKTVRNQVNNALKILRVKLGLLNFLLMLIFY